MAQFRQAKCVLSAWRLPTSARMVSAIDSIVLGNYVVYALTALLIYDFFLTVAAEKQHIWRSKKTLVFYLFAGLRYGTLCLFFSNSLTNPLPLKTTKECSAIVYLTEACFIVASVSLSGLFWLRTFAIWNRNLFVMAGLGAMFLGKVVLLALGIAHMDIQLISGPLRKLSTCAGSSVASVHISTVNDALIIAFDTAVLILTLWKTARRSRPSLDIDRRHNYSYYILRDGLLYYVAIELLNIASFTLEQIPSQEFYAGTMGLFEEALCAVIAQRLVLNLRHVADRELGPPTLHSQIDAIEFAHGSVIGNIGAPLRMTDTGMPKEAAGLDNDNLEMVRRSGVAAQTCPP